MFFLRNSLCAGRKNGKAHCFFSGNFFRKRRVSGLGRDVVCRKRKLGSGASALDQKYLQCHFFGPQTKDRDMHRKKPQPGKMYRIGEAARALDLQTSVLRFWEGEFPGLHPVRTPKGQRLYTEQDMEMLRRIRSLLHEQGMTIEGARRVLSGGAAPAFIPASSAPAAPVPSASESSPAFAESGPLSAEGAASMSAHTAAQLKDILRELREIRVLLTTNNVEE